LKAYPGAQRETFGENADAASLAMELTWIAIIASLCMGIGAVLVFVFAVKKNYFRNLEEAKYQVFWSDVENVVESPRQEKKDETSSQARR
jgi:hypothetical protein